MQFSSRVNFLINLKKPLKVCIKGFAAPDVCHSENCIVASVRPSETRTTWPSFLLFPRACRPSVHVHISIVVSQISQTPCNNNVPWTFCIAGNAAKYHLPWNHARTFSMTLAGSVSLHPQRARARVSACFRVRRSTIIH